MSADVLREAAAAMRERAQAATQGAWVQNGFEYDDAADVFTYDVSAVSDPVVSLFYAVSKGNAEHAASWHPVVALAVADWLDNCGSEHYCSGPAEMRSAVAVARAYLNP